MASKLPSDFVDSFDSLQLSSVSLSSSISSFLPAITKLKDWIRQLEQREARATRVEEENKRGEEEVSAREAACTEREAVVKKREEEATERETKLKEENRRKAEVLAQVGEQIKFNVSMSSTSFFIDYYISF